MRARTLSQKSALSERIYRLVFWLYAVYTIGPCARILILLKDDKKTGGSFLYKQFRQAEVTRGARSLAGIDRRG
ncbi:hypothetical protein EMIT0P2_20428 [Pseudomonas sp. IT-P2]